MKTYPEAFTVCCKCGMSLNSRKKAINVEIIYGDWRFRKGTLKRNISVLCPNCWGMVKNFMDGN